jgi:hypothetical protein
MAIIGTVVNYFFLVQPMLANAQHQHGAAAGAAIGGAIGGMIGGSSG